jgi:heme exporter protein C
MSFLNLANPHRFQKLACVLIPILAFASMLLIDLWLFLGFCAPTDYQQGEMVRVMYFHVPFAWLSLGAYAAMVVAALGTLVWRHPLADIAGMRTLRILAATNGETR